MIIVEGFFDAAKVWQAGYRNVVALMGSSLSDVQAGLLPQHFWLGLLMLDGDSAGQAGYRSDQAAANRGERCPGDSPQARCAAGPTGAKRDQ